MKQLFIVFLVTIVFFGSCKKEKTTVPETTDQTADFLSSEALAAIAQMPDETLSIDSVLLPNGYFVTDFLKEYDQDWLLQRKSSDPFSGKSAFEIKNTLIGRFAMHAVYLTDRMKHQYPAEGLDKPKQNGLAYVYGSNTISKRNKPVSGSCKEFLYGFDCSGFLYNIFVTAGLPLIYKPAANQKDVNYLNNAFKNFPSMVDLEVKDLKKLPIQQIEVGDIIYWNRLDNGVASHIGIVLKDGQGKLFIFMSAGEPNPKQCATNYDLSHGPKTVNLNNGYWMGSGSNWTVVRIDAKDPSSNTSVNCTITYNCGITGPESHGIGFPRKHWLAEPCKGKKPYMYKMSTEPNWQASNGFTIPKPGTYQFMIKDANGCLLNTYRVFN